MTHAPRPSDNGHDVYHDDFDDDHDVCHDDEPVGHDVDDDEVSEKTAE